MPRANQHRHPSTDGQVLQIPAGRNLPRAHAGSDGEESNARRDDFAPGKGFSRHGICKRKGLTAKDYIVGVRALRRALWLAEGMQESPDVFASPANLALATANLAELRPKWDTLERRRK